MPGNSDTDSSPKPSSSADSSFRGDEQKPISGAEGSQPYDPGSPSNAQQSSDESGSSDGVLVELPENPDQDSRRPRRDPDSGILVNIDGSMQEPTDESGREETFEDASDQLGMASARSSGLEESIAVIEIGESSADRLVADDLARVQARLEDTMVECRKYKEEREIFGKEVVSLRQSLQDILARNSLLVANKDESDSQSHLETSGSGDRILSSPAPLHSMLDDCFKFLVDLKDILDKRINSERIMPELYAALNAKDQEIEDLNVKALKSSVSHDVVVSYLGSLREIWSETKKESTDVVTKRILESLASVVGQEHVSAEDSPANNIFLAEKKTLLLIEKHRQFLSEIQQLQQCLLEVGPAFAATGNNELDNVFSFAREELFEMKRKEAYFQEKMVTLEEENGKLVEQIESMRENLESANLETNKTKAALEQAENKLVVAKEKLSIAVTKGKSLVQHRDSLKQSLAEKTSELEKCMEELQQKSETLQATEASLEELKHLLSEKMSELEKCFEELQQKTDDLETVKASVEDMNATCNLVTSLQDSLSQRDNYLTEIEEIMSQTDTPQEVLSMEITDKVRWFVNQKNVADIIIMENKKIRDAISSVELPEDVSPRELDSQINWLVNAITHAKDDIIKLQDEISGARHAAASHESEMFEMHKEIDHLESSLLEEKLEKETLHNEHEVLKRKYEENVQNLSMLSSDKAGLMKALLELSETTLDDQLPVDTSTIIDKCMIKINERMNSSLTEIKHFERMQKAIYVTDQELKLYEKILEDEMIDRSAMIGLSEELEKLSNELIVLKNEKASVQKELERAEEKSSLLREKLSMAVKKGKGLVQEREGFKLSLEEKTSEIEKLKHELQLKDSTINNYQEQIRCSSAHTEKLEEDIVTLKNERDQSLHNLHESRTILNDLVTSIETIALPPVYVTEEPLEKVNWIAEHIHESELEKKNALQELDKLKEEANLQAGRLADAFATIKSLEDDLSKAEKHVSFIAEEKSVIQLDKVSVEQELEKLREDSFSKGSKLSEAYATIKSLEDALAVAERDIAQLNSDRNQLEANSKQEIVELNAKLVECKEELTRTHSTMENYSAELNSQLGHLHMFIKDDSIFSMIAEQFNKKIEGLRKMDDIIQNIHDHFASKGIHVHPSLEHDPAFRKISSSPRFEDFKSNRAMQFKESVAENVDALSWTTIIGGLHARAEFLGSSFEDFCKGLDEHIAGVLEALEATRNKFVYILEYSESLMFDVHKLEAHNEAQQAKLVTLQKGVMTLFSACVDATRELVEFNDSSDSASTSEKEAFTDGLEDMDSGHYAKAAEGLLLAAKRIKDQIEELSDAKKVWLKYEDDIKNKLKEAESTAKAAVQEQMLQQERVSTLERDLEELNELCNEMKNKIETYQAKEDRLRDKEEEILSMRKATDRGISGQELSESQINTLMDKVNKLEIPFDETELGSSEVCFSSPVEKLFFIVDKVIDMQQKMNNLNDEKEDMQLILSSHVREIEYLREAAETMNINSQELELRKNELLEMTGGLERIIRSLGGYDALQDQKPVSVKQLLSMLERLTTASNLEFENLKSRAQELGSELQSKDTLIDDLSEKVKILENSIHARSGQQEITKERTFLESTPAAVGSEISEIEDVGPLGKSTTSTASTAAQLRTMRKGSNDHLVLNIDSESDRLIAAQEADAKGHVFKSLNTSGLIPKQGKLIADRIDGIWVSGGQMLMRRPEARLGLMAYLFFMHLWLLGTIL
ncbi:unnamed protein product [Musa acuminata var. zebrina]